MRPRINNLAIRFAMLLSGCLLVTWSLFPLPTKKAGLDASFFLEPDPTAGQTLSDITYRVIAINGHGMDDSVVQTPATGTYTFLPSDSRASIKWTVSVRMDGKMAIQDEAGEYRDHGTTICSQGECKIITDASGPFYNPTIWGNPQGALSHGQSWTVELKQPWELGPRGRQTVTVLLVDLANCVVMLKREGEGVGPYEGGPSFLTIMKGGKPYKVHVEYGLAHWSGQAIFRHAIVVSDELLCVTPLELSSQELGVMHAVERQYMSLLEHPGPIAN
jgi:hypothetical protein